MHNPDTVDGANALSSTAERKIVLAGNPNVGKSVVFHGLTGVYVDVSNYPGTTIDVSSGRLGDDIVLDTPGVYGVSAFNDEERVARSVILEADVVVNVVDAAHLDRDLFLTLQLLDMGFPTVVVLNMVDEAKAQGLEVDVDKLSSLLGVEVVPTVAVRREGLDEIRVAVDRARRGHLPPEIQELLPSGFSQVEAVMIAEDDEELCRHHGLTPPGTREEIYRRRRERVDAIAAAVVQEVNEGARFATRLGRWTLQPVTGTLILVAVLVALYYLLGVGVAQKVVDVTEGIWIGEYYIPWITALVTRVVDPGSVIGQLLVGEFGVLTMTVSAVLGLLLPLVASFYLILSLMEDSGYLPRVAVLMDRGMSKIGLNGRAIIPMILGFGCVTMATATTRLMGTKRERTIATFLLSLSIPCSAQLAVIAAMLPPLGLGYSLIFVGVILMVYGITGRLLNKVLPGTSSDLLIDLPPLRKPRLSNTLQKAYLKSKGFLLEAIPIFGLGSVLISLLSLSGVLGRMEAGLAPITTGWLGLPAEAGRAFLMGFIRRDFGAAGLLELSMTPHQVLVSLVTITLFVPCLASVLMIFKERGRAEAALIWLGDLAVATFVGGLLNYALFWG